eukprot:TRINITY_DN9502_c1_g1_i1.p1 TRINITY_DN9502_c1_g1~~TRINITY_DN9502_c1_g1_i1.p1  ORF type:complete len:529 (-),score=122.57 TRINITY_DN9502_c1_g1_i1:114-1649(-)
MAVGEKKPLHSFEKSADFVILTVELPGLESLEAVELDVGSAEVKLRLPEKSSTSHLIAPTELINRESLGEATARFSKKRKELIVKWPIEESPAIAAPSEDETTTTIDPDEVIIEELPSGTTQREEKAQAAPPAGAGTDKAYGSIWNTNSWHWEEKNCLELARAEVQKALVGAPGLKFVKALGGACIVVKEIDVKGDASFALRKGRRLLCYELSVSFKWEGRDDLGGSLGVKGTGKASGLCPDEGEEPEVEIEVSASSSGGAEAKAAGQWMKGAGVRAIAQALAADIIRPAITAAEVVKANPNADRERREAEKARASEAAKSAAADEQRRIAAEQKRLEEESRSRRPLPVNEVSSSASVWNVNGWHWEEKPMTDWSRTWLSQQFKGLSPLSLMSGLAEVSFSDIEVTGDASVSVRKGKPIVLFLLKIECKWECSAMADGLGDARGSLILPEFSSEDGSKNSVIQVETKKDGSGGRLGTAVRKEAVRAVREVLARYEETLRNQLHGSKSSTSK